jgi:hypothetical protein
LVERSEGLNNKFNGGSAIIFLESVVGTFSFCDIIISDIGWAYNTLLNKKQTQSFTIVN